MLTCNCCIIVEGNRAKMVIDCGFVGHRRRPQHFHFLQKKKGHKNGLISRTFPYKFHHYGYNQTHILIMNPSRHPMAAFSAGIIKNGD